MRLGRVEPGPRSADGPSVDRASPSRRPNPIAVIVGCGGSGTSEPARLLDAHPQVAVAPHMAWLTTMPYDRDAVGADGIALPGIARRIAEAHARHREPPPVPIAELESLLAPGVAVPYRDFVALLLDRHAASRGKALAVLEAPDMAPALADLAALWPRTRVVHVIRDGRAIALDAIGSRRPAPEASRSGTWAEDPVAASALRWERHVRRARATGALLGPERYREVRHEELVRASEEAWRSLCAFLEVQHDEAMTRIPTGSRNGASERTALATHELARWEAVAGDLLDELGYARRTPPPSAAELARAAELRDAFELTPSAAHRVQAGARPDGGHTVWLTGLSGAGKSTVARLVEGRLRDQGVNVEVLDGDGVRRNLSKGLGFSREDRDTNIRRIAYVADLLSRNGVTVIVAAISPYRAVRDEARALMGARFVEVHVHAPVNVCAARDVKGLYAKAFAGEIEQFTGVSDPYEPPLRPDVVLDTERETPESSAERLLAHLGMRTVR